jgi:hypothetical protein
MDSWPRITLYRAESWLGVPGMDETQDLALRALRDLLDDSDRTDWDELLAANRALIREIETGRPMTWRKARIVAEYLREAGWREGTIGAATKSDLTWNLLVESSQGQPMYFHSGVDTHELPSEFAPGFRWTGIVPTKIALKQERCLPFRRGLR